MVKHFLLLMGFWWVLGMWVGMFTLGQEVNRGAMSCPRVQLQLGLGNQRII